MNRYSDEINYNVNDSHGNMRDAKTFREIDREYDANSCSLHIVKDNENLYDIANEYYNDFTKWYIIADKNPEVDNPFNLKIGSQLIIPSLLDIIDYENEVDIDNGDEDNEMEGDD